jgi:hypothetical protein
MKEQKINPDLKKITALKKKVNWGEVPAIYNMMASDISELDGILSYGFDSAFKTILNPNKWNLTLLGGYKDEDGNLKVKNKPQISLHHVYGEMGYELHCYPILGGMRVNTHVKNKPNFQFESWIPETMRMLFRLKNLIDFILYSLHSGDEVDLELIKYAHNLVEDLIAVLNESFEITGIQGYSIREFYQRLAARHADDELHGPSAYYTDNT